MGSNRDPRGATALRHRITLPVGQIGHYSRPLDRVEDQGYTFAFTMKRGQGLQDKSDGICFRNVLATYTHLHALGTPEWSAGLMRRAVEHRRRKNATDRESGS
jgi:cobyrinic acid a,c-diamide synthase